MRKIITSILCILLAAVLVSLGGYFLSTRNDSVPDTADYENFQFVTDEDPAEDDEIVFTYSDIEYTEDGFVPTASEVVAQICTGEDMLVIADHPDLKYKLMNDIDMSGIDWIPVPLTGSFDGQGFTIYNLSVAEVSSEGISTRDTGYRKHDDTRFAGLFSVIDHAEVSNLNLTGAYIDVEAEQSCFAGTIAGCSDNSVIENCIVDSHIHLCSYGANNGAGGLVGFGTAEITGCTVTAEIVYADRHTPDFAEGSIGGVLGCGMAQITGCTVNEDIYATCNAYLMCGGVSGQFSSCGFDLDADKSITNNTVKGRITCGGTASRAKIYCSEINAYLNGVRAAKFQQKDFDVKIEKLIPADGEIIPECDVPECIESVTEATCEELGYTVHTCKNCGYSYTDSYVIPRHTDLNWKYIEEPKPGIPGKAECYCGICGKLLCTATVETSERPPALSLSFVVLDMEYGSTALIDANNERGKDLTWTSDAPEIASVDDSGRVSGNALGSTVITCTDGETTVKCKVNVNYSEEQNFFRKFLFGWAWMD